jgi:hypothetical protein
LPAPSDPARNRKRGIELKQARCRVTRLGVTSEMGESGPAFMRLSSFSLQQQGQLRG